MAKKNSGGYKIYKTYRFVDKDPVIDILRTAFDDTDTSYAQASRASGVSTTTYNNWFKGSTRRPQFASVQATAKAMGYEFTLTGMRKRFGKGGSK